MNHWSLLSLAFSILALVSTLSALIYQRRVATPRPSVIWNLWITTIILAILATGCAYAGLWWYLLSQNATLPPHA